MKKKIFCFDIDNVICKTNKSNYLKSKPNIHVINLINKLHNKNHIIKIFTARYMGRSKENILLVKKKYYKKIYQQLKKWNLKFDYLILGKPTFDVYVDDKNFDFKKNWINKFSKLYL